MQVKDSGVRQDFADGWRAINAALAGSYGLN
jgi:hypothetical protein